MLLQLILATALMKATTAIGSTILNTESNQIAEASNDFSSKLYQKLSSQTGNLFYSPQSISTAFAMLFYGARGNTKKEMEDVLGYSLAGLTDSQIYKGYEQLVAVLTNSQTDYTLDLANAAVVQKDYPVHLEYIKAIKSIFKAEINITDFKNNGQNALNEINAWVRSKTRDKIEKILDSIEPSTIMILLNAVYFKGIWMTQFNKTDTKQSDFYNDGKEANSKQVDMMNLKNQEFRFYVNDEIKVLELPYKGKDICMRIILPNQRDGISNLESKLSSSFLKETWGKLQERTIDIVRIPKFKIDCGKELKEILISLGMKSIFSSSADLSGIGKNLEVSDVKHKAFVEVNEEGSEAAAVTAITVRFRSAINKPETNFIADHPFLFYIIDKRNDMILFCGRTAQL